MTEIFIIWGMLIISFCLIPEFLGEILDLKKHNKKDHEDE